jgi:predicted hotdog family 3-hydroxylacyl-ACP dehydratase
MSEIDGGATLDRLLPHAAGARLVRAILELGDDAVACSAVLPADSPYASAGRVPAFVGLEIAAQAAAVLEALGLPAERRTARRGHGYLVRARRVRSLVDEIPVERPLVVRVRRAARAEAVVLYEAELTAGGAPVLRGSFSLYLDRAPDPPTAA